MAVSIRLRREGALNRPYYKVVVADSRSPRDGKFIEIIGTYDPKVQGDNSTLKIDRAEHWIARGALAWLELLGNPDDITFRFDIVEIVFEGKDPSLHIIKDAFKLPEPYVY